MRQTMLRRQALAALATLPLVRAARAQGWQPTRPVQCIIGFAPGGGADLIARAVVQAATPLFPQPLVVVNKPGGGGVIAAEQVANAVPDGHTLLMGGGSESISLPAFRQMPYDPRRSFRPVLRLLRQRMFVLAKADGRFRSMRDAVEAARAAPGTVSHGSSGVGGIYHAAFVVLERRAGVEFLHVPFTGGAPGLQAVAAGQVDLMVASPEEFRGLTDGGTLRVLACVSADRAPAFPEVPTLTELGYAVDLENMKGWVAPAATPDTAAAYLHDRFRQAMHTPVWQSFLDRAGDTDGYLSGPDFQAAMNRVLDAVTESARRG